MEKLAITEADTVRFTKVVQKIKLFSSMNMGILEKVLNRIYLYKFNPGEKICRQGDPGDAFYVVDEGKLRVCVREAFFFYKTLAILGPGDCFGEMALLNREPRNATVICKEPSKVFVLMANEFDKVLTENPVFASQIRRIANERSFDLKYS